MIMSAPGRQTSALAPFAALSAMADTATEQKNLFITPALCLSSADRPRFGFEFAKPE
jgi:hypothetical protein